MEQPHTQLPQQAEQQQAQGRRAQLQQTLLALGVPDWLLTRFTVAHLNIILREGFSDLASFQSGATPEAVCLRLKQAGVPLAYACAIEGALEDTATVQQWRKQQGLKEGDVASRGGHGGGVGPAAGLLRPAAHTPPRDTDAGHAHDQQRGLGLGICTLGLSEAAVEAALRFARCEELDRECIRGSGCAGHEHCRPRLYVAIIGSYAACVKHALDLGLGLEPAMAVVGKAVASIRGSSAVPAYTEQARQSMPGAAPEQVAAEGRRLHLVAAGSKTLKQLSPVFYTGKVAHCKVPIDVVKAVGRPHCGKVDVWCPRCKKGIFFSIQKWELKQVEV